MKTKTVVDATETLQTAGFPVDQANAQVRVVGSMTDHLASKEDLDHLASKEDLAGLKVDLKTDLAFVKGAMGLNIGLFFALAAFIAWLVHDLVGVVN